MVSGAEPEGALGTWSARQSPSGGGHSGREVCLREDGALTCDPPWLWAGCSAQGPRPPAATPFAHRATGSGGRARVCGPGPERSSRAGPGPGPGSDAALGRGGVRGQRPPATAFTSLRAPGARRQAPPGPGTGEWAAPSLPPRRPEALGVPGANPCLSPQFASHILPVNCGGASLGHLPCAWPGPGAWDRLRLLRPEVCAWATRPADQGPPAAEKVDFTHSSQEEGPTTPGRIPRGAPGPLGSGGNRGRDPSLWLLREEQARRGDPAGLVGDSSGLWALACPQLPGTQPWVRGAQWPDWSPPRRGGWAGGRWVCV